MSTESIVPKVFISYSWKPTENKEKVLKIAERLMSDGIHAIIDVWDLKEGQDKYQFMEQMVTNSDIKRVLLICNSEYKGKANNKKGGVGIESLIISDEIYSKAEQTKFIPIILEYDIDDNPCVPVFVKSRIFIDLSSDDVFEENYEKLVRNIFEKPSSRRPPLGTPPAYLKEEVPIYLPTAHKVAAIKKALLDERKNAVLFIQDYLDTFVSAIRIFLIETSEINKTDYDEVILLKIEELRPLRDDFLDFLETYCKFSIDIDSQRLHGFFERLLEFLFNLEGFTIGSNYYGSLRHDHFRFFFYELFLYFTAKLIENERFIELAYILSNNFLITHIRNDKIHELSLVNFNNSVSSIDVHRNRRLSLNRTSITADLIEQRVAANYKFEYLKQADALLYYLSIIDLEPNSKFWFPYTSCYEIYNLPLFKKAISCRHFDKIKVLFDVQTKDELRVKVMNDKVINKDSRLQRFHYELPYIQNGLNLENLCSIK